MKQSRVLVISNMYPGEISETYGIFVKNHVEELRQRGLSVDVAAVTDPRLGKKHVIKKYLKWMTAIGRKILAKGKTYDVVHAHYVFPAGLFGLLMKRLYGTRMIVTAHGGDINRMAKKNKYTEKLTKKILSEADHVIAVGEGLKSNICQHFAIDDKKVSVINMGVNREVFKSMPQNEALEQLSIGKDGPVILFVGNIIKAKGINELIEAFSRLKETMADAELHLVGPVKNDGYIDELKHRISQQQIENVYFHGAKSQAETARFMSAADVFALPSHMEGFGLVALEAMSCHTPVVGSDVGGLSHLLAENRGELVQPQDVSSLYHGLINVLTRENTRQTLVDHGEQKAQEFDQSRMIDWIMKLYFPG